MPMNVFVTDGDHRPALAIVRALGRRGASVIVGAEKPTSLASSSKYCARHVTYPSPQRDRKAFEQFLAEFVAREQVDVVLPVTDVTTHAVCAVQDVLSRYTAVAVPPLEAFDFVSNKGKLLERARHSGLTVPQTLCVEGAAGLAAVVGRVRYPAVVKPIRSRFCTEDGWLSATVHYAYSEEELWRLYRTTDALANHPSLIQERIIGPGIGAFFLFDRGELVAEFAHRRLREKPPSGGASVFCASAPVEAQLRQFALRMLGPIGWHGVAMMEYKQDHRTGDFYLMEVNGRFWGSLQLAIDAGVDFPYLVCELALGRTPAISPAYNLGVKSRWLLGDFDHLLLRLFKSDRELQLPESTPSRLRALGDFLKFGGRDVHYDVISADDRRPFLYELRRNASELSTSAALSLRRRLGRKGRLIRSEQGTC
jgi:predicted ATP-grasp superfamily ATP-dependent carboligase